MNEGYYITEEGKMVMIPFHNEPYHCDDYTTYLYSTMDGKSVMRLEVNNKNIVELVVPEGYFSLYCDNNVIQILHLPDTIEYCSGLNNNINELIIGGDNVMIVIIDSPLKKIVELKPNSIMSIHCSINTSINPFIYPNINFFLY